MAQEEQYASLNLEELYNKKEQLEETLDCVETWIELREKQSDA